MATNANHTAPLSSSPSTSASSSASSPSSSSSSSSTSFSSISPPPSLPCFYSVPSLSHLLRSREYLPATNFNSSAAAGSHFTLRLPNISSFPACYPPLLYSCPSQLYHHPSLLSSLRVSSVLAGHTGCVNRLAFTRDGTLLASVSDDCTVRIWPMELSPSESLRHAFALQNTTTTDSGSQTERAELSSSPTPTPASSTVRLTASSFDQHRPSCIATINTGHSANIFAVGWLDNDQRLGTAGMDCEVRISSIARCANEQAWHCHSGRVKDLEVDVGNDRIFFTASEDGTSRLFDIRVSSGELHCCASNATGNAWRRRRRFRFFGLDDSEPPVGAPCKNVILNLGGVGIKAIRQNPVRTQYFACASGQDPFIRVYDFRFLSRAHAVYYAAPPSMTATSDLSDGSAAQAAFKAFDSSLDSFQCASIDYQHSALDSVVMFRAPNLRRRNHCTFISWNDDGTKLAATYSGEHAYIYSFLNEKWDEKPEQHCAKETYYWEDDVQIRTTQSTKFGGDDSSAASFSGTSIPLASSIFDQTAQDSAIESAPKDSKMSIDDAEFGPSPSGALPLRIQSVSWLVNQFKEYGNFAFNNKDYDAAIAFYSQAIQLICSSSKLPQWSVLYSNLSAAYLKRSAVGDALEALHCADNAIGCDASMIKAHFRRIQALFQLNRLSESRNALLAAEQRFDAELTSLSEYGKLKAQIESSYTEKQRKAQERVKRKKAQDEERDRKKKSKEDKDKDKPKGEDKDKEKESPSAAAASSSSDSSSLSMEMIVELSEEEADDTDDDVKLQLCECMKDKKKEMSGQTADSGAMSVDHNNSNTKEETVAEHDANGSDSASPSRLHTRWTAVFQSFTGSSGSSSQQRLSPHAEEGKTEDKPTERPRSVTVFDHRRRHLHCHSRPPACQQYFARCVGQCNVQTDIKEIRFWQGIVVAGSDDGRVYYFSAEDGSLIHSFYVSADVINCVLPHPRGCIFAVSGIDHEVRLLESTNNFRIEDQPNAEDQQEEAVGVMLRRRRRQAAVAMPSSAADIVDKQKKDLAILENDDEWKKNDFNCALQHRGQRETMLGSAHANQERMVDGPRSRLNESLLRVLLEAAQRPRH